MDDNGDPIYDGEKKTLLDRVEFHESDLLSYCKDHKIELERIVGCIPQVHIVSVKLSLKSSELKILKIIVFLLHLFTRLSENV